MKRIVCLVLILVLVLSLCACAKEGENAKVGLQVGFGREDISCPAPSYEVLTCSVFTFTGGFS